MAKETLYDVIAISLKDGTVRFLARGKTLPDAEAIVTIAICRRGCDEEIFSEAVAGRYSEGDKWEGV